jgi:flagellar hook-length control protein FliK
MSAPITVSVAVEPVPALPVTASGDTAANGDSAGQFANAITDALPAHGQGGKPPAKDGTDDAAALADAEALLATLLPMPPVAVGPQPVPPRPVEADRLASATPVDAASLAPLTEGDGPTVDATESVLAEMTPVATAEADPIDVPAEPTPPAPHGKSEDHSSTPLPVVGAARAADTAARQSIADLPSTSEPDELSVTAVDADQHAETAPALPATTVGHAAQPAMQHADTLVSLPTPAVEPRPSAVDRPADASPAAVQVPLEQPVLGLALARLRNRGDGTHELTVSLHPAELGQVGVTATVRDGALTVTVACADHVAHDAVRAALPTLHHELQQAGFTGVDVALDHRGAQHDARPAHPLPDLPANTNEHAEVATDTARLSRRLSPDAALDRWL